MARRKACCPRDSSRLCCWMRLRFFSQTSLRAASASCHGAKWQWDQKHPPGAWGHGMGWVRLSRAGPGTCREAWGQQDLPPGTPWHEGSSSLARPPPGQGPAPRCSPAGPAAAPAARPWHPAVGTARVGSGAPGLSPVATSQDQSPGPWAGSRTSLSKPGLEVRGEAEKCKQSCPARGKSDPLVPSVASAFAWPHCCFDRSFRRS